MSHITHGQSADWSLVKKKSFKMKMKMKVKMKMKMIRPVTEDLADPILTVRVEFELGFLVVEAAEARLLRLVIVIVMWIVMVTTTRTKTTTTTTIMKKMSQPGGKRSPMWEKGGGKIGRRWTRRGRGRRENLVFITVIKFIAGVDINHQDQEEHLILTTIIVILILLTLMLTLIGILMTRTWGCIPMSDM